MTDETPRMFGEHRGDPRDGCADCALRILDNTLFKEGEWTIPYVLAGVIASNLAVADAVDALRRMLIDKLPDPSPPYQSN